MKRLIVVLLAAIMTACSGTPTSPTDTDNPRLFEFTTNLLPGGAASRTFQTATDGTITITLKSTAPSGVVVGLGIGIPRANSSCALTASVETVAGAEAQISMSAEKGTYCAKVYDIGAVAESMLFTIGLSHP